MSRLVLLATLSFLVPAAAPRQVVSVVHIKVFLIDEEQKAAPVPRHALLISDNPATATPRRIVTGVDGTADVKLRPGSYTIESDRPVAFHGKAYQWTQIVEIVAGRDTLLELTDGNAEVEAVTGASPSAPALEADPAFLLPRWKDSVVALWTPTTHASGFVIDARGLVVTNQRIVGTATSIEVQLTPAVKVKANVLVADQVRDVAVLWIDPTVVAAVPPVPIGCGAAATPAVTDGQEVFTIGAPLHQDKGLTSARVSHVEPRAIVADFRIPSGSAGGPVFTAAGEAIGVTSVDDEADDRRRGDARIVTIDRACDVVAAAETKMKDATPPAGTHLPVEPVQPFPAGALENAAKRRTGSLSPYQMSSSDFDIAFITPVLTYGSDYQAKQAEGRERRTGGRTQEPQQQRVRPLMDFSNWSEYVAEYPPVLLIRVTPRMVEGFWTTVARGAAQTQGVSLPPIKHFKAGFSRMRAFCGEAEVTPIHPFTLEQRVSETDAIKEGLYVFDPAALGPDCGTVRLVLFSDKAPEKGDTRVVDPKVVQQVWQDFAAYRGLAPPQG